MDPVAVGSRMTWRDDSMDPVPRVKHGVKAIVWLRLIVMLQDDVGGGRIIMKVCGNDDERVMFLSLALVRVR